MANNISSFVPFLLILATLQITAAVDFKVINTAGNTPGGVRFNNDIGVAYTTRVLTSATRFIWETFRQNPSSDIKNVVRVSVFIDDMDGFAYSSGNEIHVSARYIQKYSRGNVRTEITGILFHEMAHIWQWNGNGQAPAGLIEGIADYVRLKAGYAPSHWVRPGVGARWDEGYDKTARFLDYCNGLRHGFVAELNRKMRDGYDNRFFVDLLGKTVDQLWAEYKRAYKNV